MNPDSVPWWALDALRTFEKRQEKQRQEAMACETGRTKYEVRDSKGYVHYIIADKFTCLPASDGSMAYKFFRGMAAGDTLVASFTSPVSVKEVATYAEPEPPKTTWTKIQVMVCGHPGDVERLFRDFASRHCYQIDCVVTEKVYR